MNSNCNFSRAKNRFQWIFVNEDISVKGSMYCGALERLGVALNGGTIDTKNVHHYLMTYS